MQRGAAERAVGATKLNELSSRSHAVFIIIVEKSSVLAEDTSRAETAEMAQLSGNMPGGLHSLPLQTFSTAPQMHSNALDAGCRLLQSGLMNSQGLPMTDPCRSL